MSSRGLGRALLVAGALLLLATAAIHASGVQMIAGWTADFEIFQKSALQLVWLTDSFDWAVVAAAWLIAVRQPSSSWRGAAVLLALIPAAGAAGILLIEPVSSAPTCCSPASVSLPPASLSSIESSKQAAKDRQPSRFDDLRNKD